jgi:hypothetical protein
MLFNKENVNSNPFFQTAVKKREFITLYQIPDKDRALRGYIIFAPKH